MTPTGELSRQLIEAAMALGGKKLPEVGGKKLASNFSGMMADVRKSIDEASAKVSEAVKELKAEIETGADGAAKALQAEAAEVRKGYAELLGNNPPGGPANE